MEQKTEMQRLKENADREKLFQKGEELAKHLAALIAVERDVRMESKLATNLLFGVLFVFLVLHFLPVPLWLHFVAGFMLGFALIHSNFKDRVHALAQGNLDGAIAVLEILGITDKSDDFPFGPTKKKRKKIAKSPFKRFKELFERVGSTNPQEAKA